MGTLGEMIVIKTANADRGLKRTQEEEVSRWVDGPGVQDAHFVAGVAVASVDPRRVCRRLLGKEGVCG
jgi:hypothetical protein